MTVLKKGETRSTWANERQETLCVGSQTKGKQAGTKQRREALGRQKRSTNMWVGINAKPNQAVLLRFHKLRPFRTTICLLKSTIKLHTLTLKVLGKHVQGSRGQTFWGNVREETVETKVKGKKLVQKRNGSCDNR